MRKFLSTWFQRYLSRPEAITLLVVILMTVVLFKIMGNVLAPIIVAAILAYLLFGMVKKLESWYLPHLLAVSLVFFLFVGVVLMLLLYLFPLLWQETTSLLAEIPSALNRGQALLFSLHDRFPEIVSIDQLNQVMIHMATYFANFGKVVVTFSLTSLFGIVTIVIYFVLVPLLVFFFLRDGTVIIQWFLDFLPKERAVLKQVWHEMYRKLSSYIRGKAIEIVVIALITIIAFWFLGLRYAVLLGALVGLSVLIPYIGVIVVTVPVIAVGLIQWGWSEQFFYLLLVYAVISIVDANILVPLLFAEVMNLHPLAIILAVLFFGSLFGFWGVFFAIPLMALLNIVLESWPKG